MKTPVDVLGRAGSVLRALSSAEPHGLSTTAVGQRTGLARPTAHRLLTSLRGEGLVERDETSAQWLLGPELYLMGAAAAPRYDVTTTARPFVRALAEATGESAFFSARSGQETVCLIREDGSFPIRSHVLHEGIRFPIGVATAGAAILAHLPEPEVEAILAGPDLSELHGPGHTSAAIRERVTATRRDGWSLNPGLLVHGSWGMGAAVFDASGRPAWALSLTGVEHRFSPDRRPELGEALLRAAHRLGRALAARPPAF